VHCASTVQDRIAIVVNPRSGSVQGADLAAALQTAGVVADVHRLPVKGTESWLNDLAGRYDILGAMGGDGTVSTVAAAAVAKSRTFAVIPAGTLNHFARDAGIPLKLEEAIRLLASGHTVLVDVGVVSGHLFLNNASIGAYPRMVRERMRARERGWPRPLASAAAVVRTWLRLRQVTVRLRIGDLRMMRRTPLIVVGNGEYELDGLEVGKRRAVSDGMLSLYVAPRIGRLEALALPLRILLRRIEQDPKFEAWRGSTIDMDLRRPVNIALDGEVMTLPGALRFSVRPRALRVIVPPPVKV
jgi:diacylglycerol kinase family enzyme